MEGIRINKYLSEAGVCSRREADRLLDEGRIEVNGVKAAAGQRINEQDEVRLDGRPIGPGTKDEPVLIAFNKPRGIVCTTSTKDKAVSITEYIGYKSRIYPVGRLDKDSQGLILLTNRGDLVNRINRARYGHEKEYVVSCRDRITEAFLEKMRSGVEISIPVDTVQAAESISSGKTGYDGRYGRTGSSDTPCTYGRDSVSVQKHRSSDAGRQGNNGGLSEAFRPERKKREYVKAVTRPCEVRKIDAFTFDIILTQGYNRQIRRMCDALGNHVVTLKRIRVMNIELGKLKEGSWRVIEGSELSELEAVLDKPDNV